MRKVIVSEFLTLDGVCKPRGDADEDRSGGFEHGGWQLPYFDDVAGAPSPRGWKGCRAAARQCSRRPRSAPPPGMASPIIDGPITGEWSQSR